MKRIIIICVLAYTALIAIAQQPTRLVLSPQDVTNDLKSLNKKMADTLRLDILLELAEHYLEQNLPDSATIFITDAKKINAKQSSRKRDGIVALWEASLVRTKGDTVTGRLLIKAAITQLLASNDEFHLMQATLEFSRCYDPGNPDEDYLIRGAFKAVFDRAPKLISRDRQPDCMSVIRSFYIAKMVGDPQSSKLYFLDRLLNAYKILNNKVDEFWTRKEIADIHYQQGHLNQALEELLQIEKEQKAGGYPNICFTYDLLSGLYYVSADYDKALVYALETIKNVRTNGDSAYLPNFYARIAFSYSATGSLSEAVEWNLRRLNYQLATKQLYGIYAIIQYIIPDLIKLGREREALKLIVDNSKTIMPIGNWEKTSMVLSLAQCYAAVKNNAMAENYAKELIKLNDLRIRQKEITIDPAVYKFLATFYFSIGQFDKAGEFFSRMGGGHKKGAYSMSILENNPFLFKLDSAKGKYLSAIQYLQEYQTVKDSVFTAAKSKQIEDLKIKYATDQKDSLLNLNRQNIALLTEQDKLQKTKLQQGAILRNISFAFACLLIIIVALVYNRYRLKQRTNKKLESQQREISKQNISLQHLVNEKEWLVKEIHHRVKNNLQMVTGLLGTQSGYLKNDIAINAITDSQRRIQSMSLIHQKLYQSNNLSAIRMTDYIHELVDSLSDGFNTGNRIRFNLEIEPIELDLAHCIPLGLILNEAITNSFKYAFPGERRGLIFIGLRNLSGNNFSLTIHDDGTGLPAGFDPRQADSMGMNLMRGLSEEIGASLAISNQQGTLIIVNFVYDPDSTPGNQQLETETT